MNWLASSALIPALSYVPCQHPIVSARRLVNRLPGPESPIVWESQTGTEVDVLGFLPLVELQLPSDATGAQASPAIDCVTGPNDPFASATAMVTWSSNGQDGDGGGVFARRYHLSPPNLPQFQVNSFTLGGQGFPEIACGPGVGGKGARRRRFRRP